MVVDLVTALIISYIKTKTKNLSLRVLTIRSVRLPKKSIKSIVTIDTGICKKLATVSKI